MFNNKTKLFLLLSVVLITMVGMTAISAADINDTISDDTQISDASSEVTPTEPISTNDNIDKQVNKQTKLSEGEAGTLSDLESDIDSATDSITLQKDYTSTSDEQPFVLDKDITIEGNGKTITAVNGVFSIASGNTVTIKNLLFTGKNGIPAMINVNGTLNLENVTFNDCFSTNYANPAVIEVSANAILNMNQCSINNTCSTTAPLRIYGYSTVNVKDTNITNVISKNSIVYVTGVEANVTLDGCILANAIGSNYGGAIYDNYRGTLIVNNCIIENNTASYRGGAIYSKANTTLTNSIIRNNTLTATSYNRPEGVWMDASGALLNVANNTFSDNHVGYDEAYYFNNGAMNSSVNITVASYDFDEDDNVVLVALVTDADGNKIGDRVGKITFTLDNGQTYTASIENGTAYTVVSNLEVDNSYRVTASYNNAPEDSQEVVEGVVNYGNVLPAMTDYTSMQEVIDSQEVGAIIKLNNRITRADSEVKVTINKDIIIDGKGLTIDASEGKMFEITNGATVTLKNVVLTNGATENLINITSGNLVLDNVIIDNSTVTNTYNKYGLISLKSGNTLTINNSRIENIKGVVLDNMAQTTIDNTTITNCDSQGNGNQPALILEKGNLTILNSEIVNNNGYSGIIYSTTPSMKVTAMNGTLTVDNTKFINNTIAQGSSVITANNKTVINGSIFENNQALRTSGANGSAVTIAYDVMNITNTVFVNNTATGDVSTAYVGISGTLDISNSILLSNDNKPLVTVSDLASRTGKAILNNNYWGINDNPTHSRNNLVVTQIEEEDYWGDMEIVNLDVTLNKWVIFDASATEDPEDNFLFNVEGTFTKVNSTDSTISDLEGTIPDYLNVTFETTAGSFDDSEVTPVNGVASSVYHAGLEDAVLTVSTIDVTKTFDITAPEIIPNNYKGLQQYLDAYPTDSTVELTMNVKRGDSENNVTIENKNLVIDGKGFTINENDGRFLMLQNANVTLKNLIIKNAGTTYNPSVLQIWTGNLVLENVTIIDSTAANKGGALVYVAADATAIINNVTFENNTARFISNAGTTVINNSVIKNTNASTADMSIWAYNNGILNVTNTVFDSNVGYYAGFGAATASVLTFDNATFINNTLNQYGSGVVLSSNGTLVINNSLFENNGGTVSGATKGLIYIRKDSTIDNTTFINNKITSSSSYTNIQGGVVYIDASGTKLNMTGDTLINNTAKEGSAIFNYYGSFNISNSIIIDSGEGNTLMYTDWLTSYANNNWWGANEVPRDRFRVSGSYKIITDTWVIMDASIDDTTITTTFNQVTDESGTISDLEGTLPDGLEVTYEMDGGSLDAESTAIVNGETTNTFTAADDNYVIYVTQADETIVLGGDVGPKTYIITNATYPEFFNEDGTPKSVLKAGSIAKLSGIFTNKNFIINIPLNITTDEDQAVLVNSSIVFTGNSDKSNLTSVIIMDENYVESVIDVDGTTDILIENVTIVQYNDEGVTHAINLHDNGNAIINNNTISTTGPDANVVYDDDYVGHTVTSSISGFGSNGNIITNNYIVTNTTDAEPDTYGSVYGIELAGNQMDFDGETTAEDNLIDNNTVITQSAVYNYGISVLSYANNNHITNNNITGIGDFDAHGIQVAGPANYNVVSGNIINVTANDVTYALYISTNGMGAVTNNNITNNNITAKSHLVYGVELWATDSSIISNNTLVAEGNYTLGIGAYNVKNDKFMNNTINVKGYEEGSTQTVDYIVVETSGIKLIGDATSSVQIIGNNITVESTLNEANAVNITGLSGITVTDNYLVTPTRMGNGAVDGNPATNTIKDNLPVSSSLIITDDTYDQFFDENGVVRPDVVLPNSELQFSGEFYNRNLTITMPLNLTTYTTQAEFYNTVIVITKDANGTNITDFRIFDENYAETVIDVDGASNIVIENVTIDQYNDEGVTHAIYLHDDANNVLIENNTISTVGPDANVEYDDDYVGHTVTSSISGYDTSNNTIRGNTIVTMANGEEQDTYGTIYGIEFAGNAMDFDEETVAENNLIENNTIYTESGVYNYGVSVLGYANNNKIINNNITGIGDFDAHGVQVAGPASNNLVEGNTINLTANNVTYGIYVSTNYMGDVEGNNITNNTIFANSSLVYGMELWMVDSNIVSDNTIVATGNYTLGIGTYTTSGNTISNNIINVTGAEEGTPVTMDNILAETTGIKITGDSTDNAVTGNTINVVSTKDEANAINITGEDNTVTGNYLETPVSIGDYAVTGDSEANTIENNLPNKNETSITVTVDSPVNVNDAVTIDISVSANDVPIANSNVTITIGDEEPFTQTTSETGTISYDYTPAKSGEFNISVSYEGDRNNTEAENSAMLVVNKLTTNIVITEVDTVKVGDTVIINAVLTSGDKLVSDETVTATVGENDPLTNTTVNGVAKFTVDFTDAGEYTIVVTYDGNDMYENSTSSITLTVDALNTIIDANATSLVKYGQPVTINVTVTDENGELLEGINGTIYVNDVPVTDMTTDANGAFTYDYTTDTLGLNTVTIETVATNNYNANTYYTNFGVDSLEVVISGEDVTGTTLTDVTIVVSVVDENDNPINEGTVVFTKDNEEVLGEADVTEGSASLTTVFNKPYDGVIIVTYAESGVYSDGEGTLNANISKIASTITIDPVETVMGESTTFTVAVVDANGNNVNGGKVIFKVNGKTLKDDDGEIVQATVSNGVATVNYVVPESWKKGVNLSAKYGGTSSVDSSTSEAITVTPALRNATITVTPATNTVIAGDNVTYIISVSDSLNNQGIDGTAVIKMAGVTIGNAKVVGGLLIFNYTIPDGRRAGDYNISVVFSNSSYNRAEDNSAVLTVNMSEVYLDAQPVIVSGNDTGVVKAYIRYSKNQKIVPTGFNVAIKVNGKTLDSSRYDTGTIEFTLPATYKTGSTVTIVVGATPRTTAIRKDIQYIKI